MRIRALLILLAVTGSVQAAETGPTEQPMAWRYSLLQTAENFFEKRSAVQAPGATLRFSLPKVPATESNNTVEIRWADKHVPLPMASNTTFTFIQDAEAAENDAMVVVNRNFPRGVSNHPNVQVRSPGIPDGSRRMGDLRLACATQLEMGKAEGFKFRAMLGVASMFGLKVCDDLAVDRIDTPAGPYDTVTIEDDGQRLVQLVENSKLTQLGDKKWSDNARISYTLNGQTVQ